MLSELEEHSPFTPRVPRRACREPCEVIGVIPLVIHLREVFSQAGLVIVAAGKGTRFGGYKQLAALGGEPLLKRTMAAFDELPFAQRIVVLPRELISDSSLLRELMGPRHVWAFVEGSEYRAQSVLCGLRAMEERIEFAAVHDGARPFPPIEATWRCVAELAADTRVGGAIVCTQATDTLKRVDRAGHIEETIPRADVRRAETPQVARRALLIAALSRPGAELATDEAQALERAGHRVATMMHEGINMKVTSPQDMLLAESLLEKRPNLMSPEIETQ